VSELIVERRGALETWTLNRPQARNALDGALVSHLTAALSDAERGGADVVVLRGNGPSFCAGADLGLLATYDASRCETPRAHLTAIWDLTLAMEASSTVFVSVLHGHAVAGGLELALASDIVIAAHGTQIGDGHVLRCLIPGGGASVRMHRALGRGTAAWLALTGQLIAAQDPAFSTWLRAVVPAAELDATAESVVSDLLAVPSAARRAYKHLLTEVDAGPSTADRDIELAAFDRHWLANDVPRELNTFLNKTGEAS
jgi:enoyl-CoA hydratase